MKQLLYIFIATSIFACKSSNNNSTASTESLDKNGPVITFQKTPCFGTCPIYKAEIFADGTVKYNARRFVNLLGEHTFNIGEDFVTEIQKDAKSIGFFEMKELYDKQGVTDIPSTITTIKYKKQSNSVTARLDYPKELRILNKKIHDKIMEVADERAKKMDNKDALMDKKRNQVKKVDAQPKRVTATPAK